MADQNIMITKIQLAVDTTANWEASSRKLLEGEFGIEKITLEDNSVTYKAKLGDGTSTWTNLPYHTMTVAEIETIKADLEAKISAATPDGFTKVVTDVEQLKTDVSNTASAVETLGQEVEAAQVAIDKLNGDANTDGSVLKIVGDAISASETTINASITELSGRIDTLNTAVETNKIDIAANKTATETNASDIEGINAKLVGIDSTVSAAIDAKVDELEQQLAGTFHFRGVKDYFSEVEAVENPENGDVYQVLYAGTTGTTALNAEYAYVEGTGWVELGSIIDLSNYYDKTYIDEKVAALTAAINEKDAAMKTYVDSQISTVNTSVAANTSAISDNATAIGTANASITELDSEVEALSSKVDTIDATVKSQTITINGTTYEADETGSINIESIEPTAIKNTDTEPLVISGGSATSYTSQE